MRKKLVLKRSFPVFTCFMAFINAVLISFFLKCIFEAIYGQGIIIWQIILLAAGMLLAMAGLVALMAGRAGIYYSPDEDTILLLHDISGKKTDRLPLKNIIRIDCVVNAISGHRLRFVMKEGKYIDFRYGETISSLRIKKKFKKILPSLADLVAEEEDVEAPEAPLETGP
ncbi:MAG: hypothetical protein ACYS8W_08095 [Planctomycetota bacterium]|jgi:hypothetical protein